MWKKVKRRKAVLNRSSFIKELKKIILKQQSRKLALLLVDLKGFYRFNDLMGYDIGNIILNAMYDRLVFCVGTKNLVTFLEGATFGVVLDRASTVEARAHQIIKALEVPLVINNTEICLGSCVGAAVYPDNATTAEEWVNCVDIAMAKAKKIGKDVCVVFSNQMKQDMENQLILENDMRKALAEKQFFLEYQPQLDLNTGKIAGFEALVRWMHPEKGLISPMAFIEIAEETGMIKPLFEYVLETAFEQIKAWNKLKLGKLTMAVNLSAAQFGDEALLAKIENVIGKGKGVASYLEIEVTESLLMEHLDEAANLLDSLVKKGVRIAMDDFGTGYSSLSYLHQLPIHKIKIDKSFMHLLDERKKTGEIIHAIVNLGHALEMEVLAEGCETKKQLNSLKKFGCDSVQGFYVARPLSKEKAQEMLLKYNTK